MLAGGYTRILNPDAYVPHTTWPPGLPVLLMPSVALSADTLNYFLVKGTIIFLGLFGVWALGLVQSCDGVCFKSRHSSAVGRTQSLLLGLQPYSHGRSSLIGMDICFACNNRRCMARKQSATCCGTREWPVCRSWDANKGNGHWFRWCSIGLCCSGLCSKSGVLAALNNRYARFGILFLVHSYCGPCEIRRLTANLGFDGINQVEMLVAKVPTDLEP